MLKLHKMKSKIIIIISLTLLLAVVLFMAWDMFYNNPDDNVNPYAYDLKSLRSGDTTKILYEETGHISPELSAIHGVDVDKSDRICICGDNGVEIFNPAGDRESGFPISGTAGSICVDEGGRIYLGMQDHVEIYDKTGKKLMQWSSCGKDAIITSIKVSGKDVYLADAGNKVVYHFDQRGNLLKKIGEKDPERRIPGFIVPSPYFDLGIGRKEELWVVNPGRHQFEKYDGAGDLISSWGESSMSMEGFCGCCNPSNFAMLSDGSFVTAEKGIERIKVYSPAGVFSCVVAGPGSFIEGTRGIDVAVDSKDRILVLDPEKKEVRIFTMKKPEN
jgi:hypothetical protein